MQDNRQSISVQKKSIRPARSASRLSRSRRLLSQSAGSSPNQRFFTFRCLFFRARWCFSECAGAFDNPFAFPLDCARVLRSLGARRLSAYAVPRRMHACARLVVVLAGRGEACGHAAEWVCVLTNRGRAH
eukprot:2121785-Pleurochrysis_carterae.AAC.1